MGKGNKSNSNCRTVALDVEAPISADDQLALCGDQVKRHRKRGKPLSAEQAEERRERIEQMLGQLEDQVGMIADNPKELQKWLEGMASNRLWNYSWNNVLLARLQAHARGFDVSRLASASAWRKQGYLVKKGEKSLRILRPSKVTSRWVEEKDKDGKPVLDGEGNPKKRRVQIAERDQHGQIIWGDAPIFDISQLQPMLDDQGQPINADLQPPTPSAERALDQLEQIATENGVRVYLGAVDDPNFEYSTQLNAYLAGNPNANGFYVEIDDQRIIVTRAGMNPEAEAETLAHELAHSLLHRDQAGYKDHEDRVRKEVEAEGTAFVLCHHYGLPLEGQAEYIAHWAKGQEREALEGAMENIRKAVATVLARAEELEESDG